MYSIIKHAVLPLQVFTYYALMLEMYAENVCLSLCIL